MVMHYILRRAWAAASWVSDVNAPGVQNAKQLAAARGFAAQVHFEQCDASKNLPFDDNTFDAVFSNDVLCHLPGRPTVL